MHSVEAEQGQVTLQESNPINTARAISADLHTTLQVKNSGQHAPLLFSSTRTVVVLPVARRNTCLQHFTPPEE